MDEQVLINEHWYYLPSYYWLTSVLGVRVDRLLQARGKVAVPVALMRRILMSLAETAPFDEAFYLATYEDVRVAYEAGGITDLRRHFVEAGYFEGRLGSAPEVDDVFYARTYPDVEAAIKQKVVSGGREHYMRSGAFEGRAPNGAARKEIEEWHQAATG